MEDLPSFFLMLVAWSGLILEKIRINITIWSFAGRIYNSFLGFEFFILILGGEDSGFWSSDYGESGRIIIVFNILGIKIIITSIHQISLGIM